MNEYNGDVLENEEIESAKTNINKTIDVSKDNIYESEKTLINNKSSKQDNKNTPEQNIDTKPVKEMISSKVEIKTQDNKNTESDFVNLPIMKKFKINDDIYRLNDSLICEKYYEMYWYPILDIEKYISILNHIKSGGVKYVE